MNKKEVIRTAKAFKKILKKGIPQTVWKSSYWDIHGKRYTNSCTLFTDERL